eukprot:7575161-Pyramimonas_sp.AAC.1
MALAARESPHACRLTACSHVAVLELSGSEPQQTPMLGVWPQALLRGSREGRRPRARRAAAQACESRASPARAGGDCVVACCSRCSRAA